MTTIFDDDIIRRKPLLPGISSRSTSPFTARMYRSLTSHKEEMKDLRRLACTCITKMHLHKAAVGTEDGSELNILRYGENTIRNNIPEHAEINALKKLPTNEGKKLIPISLFVLKTTLKGTIGNSKPCARCVIIMNEFPSSIGYKLINIYFTVSDDHIEKMKLSELMNELIGDDHSKVHLSKYSDVNKYNIQKRLRKWRVVGKRL